MSDTLKGLLIIASVLTVGWILRKIRKNKVKMEDAIFWIFFAAILLLLAIFPEISYELCRIFGVLSAEVALRSKAENKKIEKIDEKENMLEQEELEKQEIQSEIGMGEGR